MSQQTCRGYRMEEGAHLLALYFGSLKFLLRGCTSKPRILGLTPTDIAVFLFYSCTYVEKQWAAKGPPKAN